MDVGCHYPRATTPSIPLPHDGNEEDEAEAAAATTSLTAATTSTFETCEDAPLTIPVHPYQADHSDVVRTVIVSAKLHGTSIEVCLY